MKNINYALLLALLIAGIAVPLYGVWSLTPKGFRKAQNKTEMLETAKLKEQEAAIEELIADVKKRYAYVHSLIIQLVDSNINNIGLSSALLNEELQVYLRPALDILCNKIEKISGKTSAGKKVATKIYKELQNIQRFAFDVKDILIPIVEFPELTFEELRKDYEKNFAPVSGGFKAEDVYPFLELKDKNTAYAMSAFQIRERIKEYRATDKGKNEEANRYDDAVLRQIYFVFDNEFVKKKFDAYLQGPEAVKMLQKKYSDILTKIASTLVDLQIGIPLFIETECLDKTEARAAGRR